MWFRKKIKPEKTKIRNTAKLKSIEINVIDHLPCLDYPTFRDSKEIARRMMISLALFQLYLEAPSDIIKNWIELNGLSSSLTEKEKEFLNSPYKELPKQDQTNIYWLIEVIWTFAWVGSLHNKLTFNTGVEDTLAAMLPSISKNESAKPFIENYKLRNQFEIFEMLDAFYRAHWFARNNNLTGIESNAVDLDIIIERRKALEYVSYKNYEWDDISLDT
jgi:hypothetical protein